MLYVGHAFPALAAMPIFTHGPYQVSGRGERREAAGWRSNAAERACYVPKKGIFGDENLRVRCARVRALGLGNFYSADSFDGASGPGSDAGSGTAPRFFDDELLSRQLDVHAAAAR